MKAKKVDPRSAVTVTAVLKPDEKEALMSRARLEGRSQAQVIMRALRFYYAYAEVDKSEPVVPRLAPGVNGGRKKG
jgi:hypothetical protein